MNWRDLPNRTEDTSTSSSSKPGTVRMTVPIFATPISSYLWPESSALNEELRKLILQRERGTPSLERSNVGGWHSSTDLFHSDQTAIRQLKNRLCAYTTDLFKSVSSNPKQPTSPKFVMEAWANVLRSGQYHSVHSHPNAFWSGVYYVTGNPRPAQHHQFSGKLEFIDPRPGASLTYTEGTALYGRFLLNPSPGQMVMFPGWLQHQVHPFFGAGERITIAFNVIVSA